MNILNNFFKSIKKMNFYQTHPKYRIEKEYFYTSLNKNEVLNQILIDMTAKGCAYRDRGYSIQQMEDKIVLRYRLKKEKRENL